MPGIRLKQPNLPVGQDCSAPDTVLSLSQCRLLVSSTTLLSTWLTMLYTYMLVFLMIVIYALLLLLHTTFHHTENIH